MPSTLQEIGRLLDSDQWTEGEKFIIKWQFRLLGYFNAALIDAIKRADDDNLARLAAAFPDEVGAFIQWNRGDLGKRLRAAGLEI